MYTTNNRWLWTVLVGCVAGVLGAGALGGCSVNIANSSGSDCTTNDDCDDGLSCTIGLCDGTTCLISVVAERCYIGGVCYSADQTHTSDSCQICDPDADPVGWSDDCSSTGGADAEGSDTSEPGADAGGDATTGPEDAVEPPDDTVEPPEDAVVPPEDAVEPPDDAVVPPDDAVVPPDDAVVPPDDAVVPPDDAVVPPGDTVEPPNPCEGLPTITSAPYNNKTVIGDQSGNDFSLAAGACAALPDGGGESGPDRTWIFVAPHHGVWEIFAGSAFDAVLYLTEGCPSEVDGCVAGTQLQDGVESDPLVVELAEGASIFITIDALGTAGAVELEINQQPDCEPSCEPGSCADDGCGGQCNCGPGQACLAGGCVGVGEDLSCQETVDCLDTTCAGDPACGGACYDASAADGSAVDALWSCYASTDCYPSEPCWNSDCLEPWIACTDHGAGGASCSALASTCVDDCGIDEFDCYDDCASGGTSEAQFVFYSILFCLLDACPSGDEGCLQDALSDPDDECTALLMACQSEPCVGNCGDSECGDDGCGGSCGVCAPGLQCIQSACSEPTPEACCEVQEGIQGCVANPACQTCVCDADPYCCDQSWDGACANRANDGSQCGGPQDCGCCEPQCDGKECGSDGCGGFCGLCGAGMACQQGGCVDLGELLGSCDKPFELGDAPVSVTDDLSGALNDVDAVCFSEFGNGNTSPDHVYRFTAQETGWYTARLLVSGWAASLVLQASCGEADSCYGESAGGFDGLHWFADEGSSWSLIVEGVASGESGIYELQVDAPCVPQCAGQSCGSDGCGGSCGTCPIDVACIQGACTDPGDPKGNTCNAPKPIGLGVTTGDTSEGSNELDIGPSGCGNGSIASGGSEIVYEFKAPVGGQWSATATSTEFTPLVYVLGDCDVSEQSCLSASQGTAFFEAGPQAPVFVVVDQAAWDTQGCMPADQLCEASGGVVIQCGSSCPPISCQQPVQLECPGVCAPRCECPAEAPYWDDSRGCIPLHQCAVPSDVSSSCEGGAFELEIAGCTPQCAPGGCGPDGCGGTCGTCSEGMACVAGACQEPTCDGMCGGSGTGGSCYCDSLCFGYGDCCADVCVECSGEVGGECSMPPEVGQVIVTEFLGSVPPFFQGVGDWFEVTNLTDDVLPLETCAFGHLGGTPAPLAEAGVVLLPGAAIAIAESSDPADNGGIVGAYELTSWTSGGLLQLTYEIECGGTVLDVVDVDPLGGGWTINEGASTQLDPAFYDEDSNDDGANWCLGVQSYGDGLGTPGAPNDSCQ